MNIVTDQSQESCGLHHIAGTYTDMSSIAYKYSWRCWPTNHRKVVAFTA